MSIPKLRDLVREAGVILPDWESANNPKYCYEWAFSDGQNAVLTQWYEELDGWRYSFLQGVHKSGKRYENQVGDIDLCTILPAPGKERRLAARITDVEVLSEVQAEEVYQRFEENGWLDQMEEEVRVVNGISRPLRSPTTFREMFNIRFKADKVSLYPKGTPLPEGISASQVNRYQIFNITEISQEPTAESHPRGRMGQDHVEPASPRTRRPTSATTYTPEHQNMQRKLMEKLKREYGPDAVQAEENFIDVRVETEQELIYYEIKTELDPRLVIRQALGQLLEYAFYQGRRESRTPTGLVIVGRCPLDQDSDAYLREIDRFLPIPLNYMEVSL